MEFIKTRDNSILDHAINAEYKPVYAIKEVYDSAIDICHFSLPLPLKPSHVSIDERSKKPLDNIKRVVDIQTARRKLEKDDGVPEEISIGAAIPTRALIGSSICCESIRSVSFV